MKRILHVSKYFFPFKGGTEQIAFDCVNALADTYEQKILCFNHEPGNERVYIDGTEVIRCKCFAKISSQSLSFSYGRVLKNILLSYKPDVIIFHYPNPFAAHYLLKYISKDTRLVVYWHLDIVKQKILGKFFAGQNRALVHRADVIIATSPQYVKGSRYLSAVPDKCKVIPNCINIKRLQANTNSRRVAEKIKKENNGKIICLAVGRLTEYKGFQYLVQASKNLDDQYVIYIIGKGELAKELKKQTGQDRKIHFLESVSDDELIAYLSVMDIFCFPSVSKNEAFGLALAEAMYFEKPAVTFTIPGSGVNYVCLNGENGIEVPNKDIDAYVKAINKLARAPELRALYGKNGKKRVMDNFLDTQYKGNIRETIDALYL